MSTGNDIAIDELKISKMKMIKGIAVCLFFYLLLYLRVYNT